MRYLLVWHQDNGPTRDVPESEDENWFYVSAEKVVDLPIRPIKGDYLVAFDTVYLLINRVLIDPSDESVTVDLCIEDEELHLQAWDRDDLTGAGWLVNELKKDFKTGGTP